MTGANKAAWSIAALLLLFTFTSVPAKAQFAGLGGGSGGGGDMMTQMAPMLEMMKAKMGKRRFGMLMKTAGPMASQMMQNGGGGFGGGLGGGGGGFTSMLSGANGSEMMSMVPQLVQIANVSGGHRRHRHR
jgi:hypothetical protein